MLNTLPAPVKKIPLTVIEKKELIKFLNSSSEDESQKTNWQVVLVEWNRNNSKRKIPIDLQMPNYKELN